MLRFAFDNTIFNSIAHFGYIFYLKNKKFY